MSRSGLAVHFLHTLLKEAESGRMSMWARFFDRHADRMHVRKTATLGQVLQNLASLVGAILLYRLLDMREPLRNVGAIDRHHVEESSAAWIAELSPIAQRPNGGVHNSTDTERQS